MDDTAAAAAATASASASASSTTLPALRHRNSIATSVVLPKQLTLPTTPRHRSSFHACLNDITLAPPSSSLLDMELVSLRLKSSSFASYTSLKDLLPSSTSPSPSGRDISIRNRLVKQAAWAYLQPNSASPPSPWSPCSLRLFWPRCGNPLTLCIDFFYYHLIPGITRILNRIIRAFTGHVIS